MHKHGVTCQGLEEHQHGSLGLFNVLVIANDLCCPKHPEAGVSVIDNVLQGAVGRENMMNLVGKSKIAHHFNPQGHE